MGQKILNIIVSSLLTKYTLSCRQDPKLLLLSPEASADSGPYPASELEGPWVSPNPPSLSKGRQARGDVLLELHRVVG